MKPSKPLQTLHNRLAQLRRRRARFRWATAASALGLAVLVALDGLFLLDWGFRQNIDLWQRGFLLALAIFGVAWAARRFALPWLGLHEDESDMALLVQKQSGIDSDLIAALQFESSDAAQWGSTQLETAVIERVANKQQAIDVMAALPREPLLGRLKILGGVVVLWLLLCCLAPQYVVIFFHRLLLSNEHYPTRTQIVAISINDRPVDLAARNGVVHVACGQAVSFAVTLANTQPADGRVEMVVADRAAAVTVPLEPAKNVADADAALLKGQYPRLNQSASCKFYVGDAWTDSFALSVTPLPAVDIEAEMVPPAYARQSSDEVRRFPRGTRQLTVVAGSEVRLKLRSDRALKSAEVKLADKVVAMTRIETSPDGGEVWITKTAGTPLAAIAKEMPFAVQIVDSEGQSLDQSLDGFISIEPDLPPRVAAATRTTTILPSASPKIVYGATDDHALSRIWYTWEVTGGSAGADAAGAAKFATSPANGLPANAAPSPAGRNGTVELARFGPEKDPKSPYPKTWEQTCNLDLQSLHLTTGDTLKVTFHASDYRGPAEPATADAEPLVFQVTDLQGFEASMFEADQKSANILETMRKNLSGQGDSK